MDTNLFYHTPPPPTGDQPQTFTHRKETWLGTMALTAAAYDDPELIAQSTAGELAGAKARGGLLLFNVVLAAGIFAAGAHYILNSGFSFWITLAAVFVAAFIGLIDHYIFLRSAMFPDGIKLMRKGGFQRDVSLGSDRTAKFSKRLRIALALALAALEAIFVGLLLNRAAVDSHIEVQYLALNQAIVDKVTRNFVADRGGLVADRDAKQRLVTSLSAQAEKLSASETKDAGRPPSRSTTKALEQSRASLADMGTRLRDANNGLTGAADKLRKADANQKQATHDAIEASPGHIPRDDSFVTRIKILFGELIDDPAKAVPAALLDFVVLGLDLAVVTLKGIPVPSTYSMLEARRSLRAMTAHAQAAAAELDPPKSPSPSPASGGDGNRQNPPTGTNGVTPPRRRGRPRKSLIINANAQEQKHG